MSNLLLRQFQTKQLFSQASNKKRSWVLDAPGPTEAPLVAWQVKSQHEPVRIAHWLAGQVNGWHIMRHIWRGELSHIAVFSAGTSGSTG